MKKSGGQRVRARQKVAPPHVDLIRQLLRGVWRIRLIEEAIAAHYHEQEMRCPTHLSIGQEAVAVGVCQALMLQDAVMSGHRAHAHYLAKGGNVPAMLAEIYGKATGCVAGRGGSQHLIDLAVNFMGSTPIVGGTIPIATGLAWAKQLQGEPGISVSFFGEGAAEEGVWHESLNFAALHKLPMLYVCENNLYSVYTPLAERQPERKLADLARAHGLYVAEGDGNNAVEVYERAQRAREHVAAGQGPAFLEFATYRWREHCGPNFDNDLGYRSEEEYQIWRQRDPLKFLQQRASEDGMSEMEIELLQSEIKEEIEAAFTFAKDSPFPANDSVNEADVYA